jgi:hypothetical protein
VDQATKDTMINLNNAIEFLKRTPPQIDDAIMEIEEAQHALGMKDRFERARAEKRD